MRAERGPDRRRSPRRQEDAALHYAEVNLLAAALAWADEPRFMEEDDTTRALWDAVAVYRQIERNAAGMVVGAFDPRHSADHL